VLDIGWLIGHRRRRGAHRAHRRWGEVFGDDIVAAAMIDRLVHHAECRARHGNPL
jgi:DNA replication protein DnaC